MSVNDSLTSPQPPQSGEIDRDALNRVMLASLEPSRLFGRDVELTDHDREQFALVKAKAEETLAPFYEDPDWKTFQELNDEGRAKGALMAISCHEGTFVPTWCVKGGPSAAIKKIKIADEKGERNGIEVPDNIFNLFHWTEATKKLDRYINEPNELLKGTPTEELGQTLKHLATLSASST